MLSNLLSNGSQNHVVGLSVTPGIGLEAVILDRSTKAILKYGKRKLDYNFSTREITDYVQFKSALASLIDEMNIAPKTMEN